MAPATPGPRSAPTPPEAEFRIKLGAVVPDMAVDGQVSLHEFLGQPPAWTVFFSVAGVFDPVAVTELVECRRLVDSFVRLGVKLVAFAAAAPSELRRFADDVCAVAGRPGEGLGFAAIPDEGGFLAERLGLREPERAGGSRCRSAPRAANALFAIGPDKTCRLAMLYPSRVGRCFHEVLRCMRSLFLTQDLSLATPADWRESERLIVDPKLSTAEAKKRFANFETKPLPSGREYLRYVDAPEVGVFSCPPAEAPPPPPEVAAGAAFRAVLGAEFPDFPCRTTKGNFTFHALLGTAPHWTIFFSHPKDFTPVCTTELGACQSLWRIFADRGVKLIGLSCDSVADHHAWSRDILAARGLSGQELDFPLIADEDRSIATRLGMLDPLERDGAGMPMPARALFLICPARRLRFAVIYPATMGRNFAEILRAVDAVLLLEEHGVSTPAGWNRGSRVLLPADVPASSEADFGAVQVQTLPSGQRYLRSAECPGRAESRARIAAAASFARRGRRLSSL